MAERGKGGGESEFGFGSLFKGIGSLFDLISKMAEEGKEEYTSTGEIKGLGDKARGVYGFSVKMGRVSLPESEMFHKFRLIFKCCLRNL